MFKESSKDVNLFKTTPNFHASTTTLLLKHAKPATLVIVFKAEDVLKMPVKLVNTRNTVFV